MAKRRLKNFDPFGSLWLKIPAPFRNKFAVVALLFFVWMAFFDKHNLFTQYSLQGSVDKLENDKNFYTEQIKNAKEERIDLVKNSEKFARERYFMSESNEDVFVIEKAK